MSEIVNIELPDIGDFADVEVIEILKSPGDRVAVEDSLITVESDKASVEIPSPRAGIVRDVLVKLGDKVSQDDAILTLEIEAAVADSVDPEAVAPIPAATANEQTTTEPAIRISGEATHVKTDLVVLGSGPGGYTAAFRAADLGKSVTLIERYKTLGGVCLNVGCIPSKALLHVAQVINEAAHFSQHGVGFTAPKIDLAKLTQWKTSVVERLTGGLAHLAKQRQVQVIQGNGRFVSSHRIQVETGDGVQTIEFDQAIVAAGSQPARLDLFPWDDPRVMDSTLALTLPEIPARLLVVGGGIIGLEMATVYHGLGSRVTVVEVTDGLIPGCDRDLIRPLTKIIEKRYENIYLSTKLTHVAPQADGLAVGFEGSDAPEAAVFDRILVATGRVPNGSEIGADLAGVRVDEMGYIPVDSQQRTNVAHIFAIGDIVGPPMLAHKATHQGKVAAEVCAGLKSHFDVRTVPSVAYTDPEVAWMGVSEAEAKKQGIEYHKGVFPWAASGRSLCLGRDEGLTKLLFDHEKRLIGAGIVGPNAGELIAETILALEMGADPQDIGLSVHPHPTLSETINFAAEVVEGTITDLYISKRAAN